MSSSERPQAMTLTAYGKLASPPSHSPWKTLRVSHRLTASTTSFPLLTSYRGTDVVTLPSLKPLFDRGQPLGNWPLTSLKFPRIR